MFTLLKFINRSRAQPLKEPDAKASDTFGLLAETEVICLKACVVEAVEQEVCQIWYDSFRTFGFEQVNNIIVGCRKKFDKNLTNNTDARLLLVGHRKIVKVTDDLTAHLLVFFMG